MVSSPDAALCVVPVDCEQIVHPNSYAASFLRLFPSLNGVQRILGGGRRRRIATGCLRLQVGVSPFSPCQLHLRPTRSRREVADGGSRSPKVLLYRKGLTHLLHFYHVAAVVVGWKKTRRLLLASTSKLPNWTRSFTGGP